MPVSGVLWRQSRYLHSGVNTSLPVSATAPPLAWTMWRIRCRGERVLQRTSPLCWACVKSKLWVNSVASPSDFIHRSLSNMHVHHKFCECYVFYLHVLRQTTAPGGCRKLAAARINLQPQRRQWAISSSSAGNENAHIAFSAINISLCITLTGELITLGISQ